MFGIESSLKATLLRVGCVSALAFSFVNCASTPTKNTSEKKSPEEISLLFAELGTQAINRGDLAQAVEDLRKALEANPKNAIAHNHLGVAYAGLSQTDLAKKEFEQALKISELYSDAWINLGNLAAERGDNQVAKLNYNKALSNLEYKLRHRALTNLAQIALKENAIEEAKAKLVESLQVNPEYCMSHYLLGRVYLQEKNAKAAVDEFKKSVAKSCNSNVEGRYQLGLAYMRSQQYEKARSELIQLIQDFPQSAQAKRASDVIKDIP